MANSRLAITLPQGRIMYEESQYIRIQCSLAESSENNSENIYTQPSRMTLKTKSIFRPICPNAE